MSKTPKKTRKLTPTPKIKAAAKYLLENLGSTPSEAMRAVGYKDSMSKNPQYLTRSKGFVKILEDAGVTDQLLARKHAQLINSSRLDRETFEAIKVKRKWIQMSDEAIKETIEGTKENPTGNRITFIKKYPKFKIALFRIPDNVVQAKMMEMGYKLKSHFAPDKMDVFVHELNEEERERLLNLNENEED